MRMYSESKSHPVVSDSLQLHGLTVHGILQARILECVAFPFSVDLPSPRIESRSPALQMDSLPAEPQAKPKNTGVSCLSILQRISSPRNQTGGLLHCRWILNQLTIRKPQMRMYDIE